MNSRERVLAALEFKDVDRLPKDLGGMGSSGISAFAYPSLVKALGLPYRRPRIYDTYQMLALPDVDVLDALSCDVVTINSDISSALSEEHKWADYDFNGRLAGKVRRPEDFVVEKDGCIVQPERFLRMPAKSYVFDEVHGGQPLNLSVDLPRPDLKKIKNDLEKQTLTGPQIEEITAYCKRVRQSTDKAIMLDDHITAGIGISEYGGIAIFSMLCLTEPAFVADLHGLITEYSLLRTKTLLPEINDYIDIIRVASDDWGTQTSLIASADIFKELFVPYYKALNDEAHRIAPAIKMFLHSCGAIYDILDLVIAAGFDILNPVQWTAGRHSYKDWKDKCSGMIALWGGGVDSQQMLPFGTVKDIVEQAKEVSTYLSENSGYVFCGIHNITAEIPGNKVLAMYRAIETLSARY